MFNLKFENFKKIP